MSIEWIRKHYGVPAKIGGRVEYNGGSRPVLGTITRATNRIYIRLDGEEHSFPYHPTWMLQYLDADEKIDAETMT